MSKGDNRRPTLVSDAEFQKNWNLVFGSQPTPPQQEMEPWQTCPSTPTPMAGR